MPRIPDLRRTVVPPPLPDSGPEQPVVATPAEPILSDEVRAAIRAERERRRQEDLVKSTPQRIHAPVRTGTEQVTPIDYASIALASTSKPEPGTKGASFSLVRIDRTVGWCRQGFLPRRTIAWSMRGLSAPSEVRLGSTLVPPLRLLDGTYEDGNLERLADRSTRAAWTILERAGDVARVTEFSGAFEASTKQAAATLETTVATGALSAGVLYAFRKCNDFCDEPLGSPLREEELVIVGPPAVWIGSSDDPQSQPVAYDQPFGIVSARLRPGTSASLSLVALKQDVDDFRERRRRVDPVLNDVADEWLTFTLDVVWPSSESGEPTMPEVNLFTGSGRGNARKLAGGDIIYSFTKPDIPTCVPKMMRFERY
jgi:hypothetical protein